jgi:predicted RNase H-like nuclease
VHCSRGPPRGLVRAPAGRPLHTRKKTWNGAEQRRQLLATAGIDLTGLDVSDDNVAVDDVLDAAAVAWTARRVLTGEATSIPDSPERFSDGLPAAISA